MYNKDGVKMSKFKKNFHIPCECFFPPLPIPEIGPIAAYGNFWQSEFITVPAGGLFSFNQIGPIAGGVSLLNPTTISITQAGDYQVDFIASIDSSLISSFPYEAGISILLNNNPIPNAQASFGIIIENSVSITCNQLTGQLILSVPANSTLHLTNIGNNNISTCDNGINAIELTIIKLN
ncbi:exosporium leader peptide [Bacillus cereus]|nr:exosporium leader peptide [Bacillus cereus]PFM33215.1 exosporium leader peptide [Bacillus cereus]PGL57763.1 exosporium leader peptide [Bacillus cereus]